MTHGLSEKHFNHRKRFWEVLLLVLLAFSFVLSAVVSAEEATGEGPEETSVYEEVIEPTVDPVPVTEPVAEMLILPEEFAEPAVDGANEVMKVIVVENDDIPMVGAISGGNRVRVGRTLNLRSSNWEVSHVWNSDNERIATVRGGGQNAVVTGVSSGTVTIRHRGITSLNPDHIEITVVPSVVSAVVYINGANLPQSLRERLGFSNATSDGHYAVGTVAIDLNRLTNDQIANQRDWAYMAEQLGNLNPSNSNNPQNQIGQLTDILERENANFTLTVGAPGISGGTPCDEIGPLTSGNRYWHLTLSLTPITMTYLYGNNGITDGTSRDGATVGSVSFVKGMRMDYSPLDNGDTYTDDIVVPDGYEVEGLYTDAGGTVLYQGVGQPINANTTAYVKLRPKQATINYVPVGTGTLSSVTEEFRVDGTPVGSTATDIADGTQRFVGWYSDEDCTEPISTERTFVPTASQDGWVAGETYTYYAKFAPTVPFSIYNQVSGNMGDVSRDFNFTVTLKNPYTGEIETRTSTLKDGKSTEAERILVGTEITVKETNPADYTVKIEYGGWDTQGNDATFTVADGDDRALIVVDNHKEVVPDTGVNMDSAPFVLTLLFAAFAAVALVVTGLRRSSLH